MQQTEKIVGEKLSFFFSAFFAWKTEIRDLLIRTILSLIGYTVLKPCSAKMTNL